MHEHHDRILATRLIRLRSVELAPHHAGAVLARHLHVLGLDPLAVPEFRLARVGQLHDAVAVGVHHRQLRRHVAVGMAHQQPGAVGRQREVLDAVERGDLAHGAARAVDRADFVVARPLLVADEVEGLAIGRQRRRRHFPLAGGQRARLAVLVEVQVRVAAALGQEPQCAVAAAGRRRPAELVEAPVDPGVVGQAVARDQLGACQVDAGKPAVLVVHRTHQHGDIAAVVAPVDGRAVAVAVAFDAHVAVALQRVLLGGLAHRGKRVFTDAGKRVELEFGGLGAGHVDQPQLVRQRRVAADARARVLEFLVARFGDVLGHLAGLAFVAGLGLGHHQQPLRIRRQGAVDDLDVVAQVGRGRSAGGIGTAPVVVLRARGLALGAVVLERGDHCQLALAQVVGLRRRRPGPSPP